MVREITINPVRTYSSVENVRKAIRKSGDEGVTHMILPHVVAETGAIRFFALFRPTEQEMSMTGVHFRWNCI